MEPPKVVLLDHHYLIAINASSDNYTAEELLAVTTYPTGMVKSGTVGHKTELTQLKDYKTG